MDCIFCSAWRCYFFNRIFVESELQEVFKQLEILGISPEALKNMYSNYLNNKDNK